MFDTLITTFAAMLSDKFISLNKDNNYFQGVRATFGGKYAKLIIKSGGQESVYMFIDRNNGAIYKAASYKAPAHGIRHYLTEQNMADLVNIADPYTRWLYKR